MSKNFLRFIFPSLLILLFISDTSHAQMFSVGSKPETTTSSNSYIRLGYAPANFSFTGNPNAVAANDRFDLNNGTFSLGLESPGFVLRALVGNNLTGLKDQTYFNLSYILSNRIGLIRKPAFSFGFPIELNTSLTSVTNEQSQLRFNQSDLGAGTGLFMRNKIGRRLTVNNQVTLGYGFSNSSGNFFGGTVSYLSGKSRINLNNVFGGRGLSIGYDFNLRSFDIEEEFYDYDLIIHELTLGISL